jgi:hypothetical protein
MLVEYDGRRVGLSYGHGGPENDHGRKPDARLDFLDDDTIGELTNGHSGRVRNAP